MLVKKGSTQLNQSIIKSIATKIENKSAHTITWFGLGCLRSRRRINLSLYEINTTIQEITIPFEL